MSREPECALTLHADPGALHGMRQWLDEALSQSGLTDKLRGQLVLAVNEACMNIIQHAYREETKGEIRLRLAWENGRLIIELEDDAPCIDPLAVQPRALSDVRPGGLGVHFIREIMDEMAFLPGQDKGNRLRLVKRLERE
ncbi:MAG: ATP-binding protein [Candidatus Thiodiazotropha sp.]